MNDSSPSFGFLVVLVPIFVIAVVKLRLILVVSLLALFLPFLQPPTRSRSFFFSSSIPFSSRHAPTDASHTRNALGVEAMYKPKRMPSFFICGTLRLQVVCVLASNYDDFVCERAGYGLLISWLTRCRYLRLVPRVSRFR